MPPSTPVKKLMARPLDRNERERQPKHYGPLGSSRDICTPFSSPEAALLLVSTFWIATSGPLQHGSPWIWQTWLAENTKRLLCACSENRVRPYVAILGADFVLRSAASGNETDGRHNVSKECLARGRYSRKIWPGSRGDSYYYIFPSSYFISGLIWPRGPELH